MGTANVPGVRNVAKVPSWGRHITARQTPIVNAAAGGGKGASGAGVPHAVGNVRISDSGAPLSLHMLSQVRQR